MSSSRICQVLHEEHDGTVLFAHRLQAMLGRYPHAHPDRDDAAAAGLLRDLPRAFGAELGGHFDFEEQRLFPILATDGSAAIGAHLAAEHANMRPLLERVRAIGAAALTEGFGDASWAEFRAAAGDLCGQLLDHVQKEEMALLPLLEESLDPQNDAGLFALYAGNCGEMPP
ncbi:MAG TPA: hemerythrin domain-containing protein [Steroidobacteraceae bacterium]|nr:hemerythrin domain-containing protein [Steroidobacteraceae bacterium]